MQRDSTRPGDAVRIELERITKTYPRPHAQASALAEIDVAADAGDVTVVLGPEGSGKTTLLRVVAGLEAPDSGAVRFNGAVQRKGPRTRNVAMVSGTQTLQRGRTVAEHLEHAQRYGGATREQAGRRAAAVARALRIGGLMDRKAEVLSAGDRQRIVLARALVRTPRAFLLDDPFANVDFHERSLLRTAFSSLQRDMRITTLHVTQDPVEAMVAADRLVLLDAGRVVQQGAPAQCYREPASVLAASVLCANDMRTVRVRVADGKLLLGGQRLLAPLAARRLLGDKAHAVLGVRASALRIGAGGRNDEPLVATVTRTAHLGRVVEAAVRIGDAGDEVLLRADPALRIIRGDSVLVHIDFSACSLFDAGSGYALWHGGRA